MIRSQVRRELHRQLSDRLAGVRVPCDYSPPPDGLEDRHVFFGAVEGAMDYPTSAGTGGRFQRDDEFTLTVWFRAHVPGDGHGVESDEACEALFAELAELLIDTPGPGIGVDGVQQAVLGDVNGPESMRTDVGHESWIEARVDVSTRLT